MKALVVDDARVARKMVARMMEQLGFTVITAEHGQDALDQLDPDDPPQAVVTDWNMPIMDGVELAKALRGTPSFATIPVLMISSEADPRRVAKALMAGVDEYLFKPVDASIIKERLEVMGVYTAAIS
ncbi:MAG: response regulator [Actinomycetia bacterium]|nr:response regulator [Actinomycetes bacterium]MCP4087148.1 response regulator [Actinomycetes bacterium]